MCKALWIALTLLAAPLRAQDLGEDEASTAPTLEELVRQLRARVDQLEARQGTHVAPAPQGSVDLSGDELTAIDAPDHGHVLSRPWYENVGISGYGAFGFLDTGDAGTTPEGSFLAREAALFFDTEIWRDVSLFTELALTRFPGSGGVRVGEIHLQLSNLFADERGSGVGMKLGRFEIPFGEEYFRWDAHETPYISFTPADPYGVDEGLELYGAFDDVHWIAAVTSGSDGSGADDDSSKLVCSKLYGAAHEDVYLSASALATGDCEQSSFRLSGVSLAPVGTGAGSALGTSPSRTIDATCWELDCRLWESRRAGLIFGYGQADVDDVAPFERGLAWYQIATRYAFDPRFTAHLRLAEIRTRDGDEGYRFSGRPIAEAEDLGYDTHSLRRLSAVLEWRLNTHLTARCEVGRDWIDLIDASTLDGDDHGRTYFGIELVAWF
jgi:hypothetical protein